MSFLDKRVGALKNLMRYNKKTNRQTLKVGLWYSLGCHALLVLALGYAAYTASQIVVSEGNPAIRAIMIDPRVFAVPPVATATQRSETVPPKKVQKHTFKRKSPTGRLAQMKTKSHPKSQEKRTHSRARTQRQKQDVVAPQRSKQATGAASSNHTQFARIPSPIQRMQPEYPMRARTMGIEGKVVVHYGIDAYGSVINIRIVEAKPNAIFNQSVQRAMRHWKYEARSAKNLTITIIFKQDAPVIIQNA